MPRLLVAAVAALAASCPLATICAAEDVVSPIYKSWAAHKVGTTITLKSVNGEGAGKIETLTTQRLLESTDEKVVLEVVVKKTTGGKMVEEAPTQFVYKRRFLLLPGVKKEDVGKPSGKVGSGEETVTVAGKEYKAQWYDAKSMTEAGESISRTWMSDEVPGKLLKTLVKVPAANKTTTTELVEIKTP